MKLRNGTMVDGTVRGLFGPSDGPVPWQTFDAGLRKWKEWRSL